MHSIYLLKVPRRLVKGTMRRNSDEHIAEVKRTTLARQFNVRPPLPSHSERITANQCSAQVSNPDSEEDSTYLSTIPPGLAPSSRPLQKRVPAHGASRGATTLLGPKDQTQEHYPPQLDSGDQSGVADTTFDPYDFV